MVDFPYIPGKVVVSGANGKNGFATMCELSKIARVSELVGLFRKPEEKSRLKKLWRAHEESERKHIHVTPNWTTDPEETRDANIWIDFRGVSLEALARKIPNLEALAIEREVHQRGLLLEENLKISSVDTKLTLRYAPHAIRIQQGNPVDVLVRNCVKLGFPAKRVISTGTLLEADRFINIFNQTYPEIALDNTCSLYLGEHGELAVPIKSRMSFEGVSPEEYLTAIGVNNPEIALDKIYQAVNTEAFELRQATGETPWEGPAAVTANLVAKLLNPQRSSPIAVSTYIKHTPHYGLDDIAISIPVILGREGVSSIVEIYLPAAELGLFARATRHIMEVCQTADKLLAEL